MTEFSDDDTRSADPDPGEPRPIHIRPAHPADAAALGGLLADALAAKYRPALGPRAADALAGVIADDLARPAHGYWVAALDGRVVAAAHLSLADDPRGDGVARRLADVVGWPRTIWALTALSVLAHGPLAADEAYVGEVAVLPEVRRRGIAARLMDRVGEAALERGKTRLTLMVTDDNVAARALYARLGFTERSARRWRLGRLVFGSPGARLLEKHLTTPDR